MWGRPHGTFLGGYSRKPTYGSRGTPYMAESALSQAYFGTHDILRHSRVVSRGKGSQGMNLSQRSPLVSTQIPPPVACWGCGGPNFQYKFP